MIVPRTRFIVVVGLVLLPCSALTAITVVAIPFAVLATLLVLIVGLLDAILAHDSLDDIQVELPDILRLTKDREGIIEMTISYSGARPKQLRLGLAFPYEIHSPQEDMSVILSPEGAASLLKWPCIPRKRGVYRFDTCYLEHLSPLGLWAFRGKLAVRSEIRVYPNLLAERHHLTALFSHRGGFGVHVQRRVGKGRDFEKLREYIPGDSFEDIHWKATAKRRHPITKVFQIERTQEVYIIIDASRLSARNGGISSDNMLERFVTAGLILGLAAQKQGDLFGLATFSDRIHGFVRAKGGKAHYNTCREALFALQAQAVNPDFDELCTFLRLRLRRRALLVFLTSLDDPMLAESFTRNIELLCRQHLILVNMLKPEPARPVFSNPAISSVDALYHELGGHLLWHDLQELHNTLHHKGVHFSLLNNEKMCVDLVSQYVNVKQRQLL